jgi:hypothetical protein
MSGLPRVILDTSVINALEDGGQQYEPLMRGLECGYEIILPATSADEIVSTKKVRRREALLSRFVRLLTVAKCIMPPHEIVRALVTEHVSNPLFDWTDVDVRAPEYEVAIPARDFDESICAENRIQQIRVSDLLGKNVEEIAARFRQGFCMQSFEPPFELSRLC